VTLALEKLVKSFLFLGKEDHFVTGGLLYDGASL
jgi:hypothetical protein